MPLAPFLNVDCVCVHTHPILAVHTPTIIKITTLTTILVFNSTTQAPFSAMLDGTGGVSCNQPTTSWKGKPIFAIMAPPDVTELRITYNRQLYAPGWNIYRDGTLVLSEASNRGSSKTPVVTYSYSIGISPSYCNCTPAMQELRYEQPATGPRKSTRSPRSAVHAMRLP